MREYNFAKINKNNVLDEIYSLAKNRNLNELIKYLNANNCPIDYLHGGYSAVMKFAQEGNLAVVEFLLDRLNANMSHAVKGAALANNERFVDKLLNDGASIELAVEGAGKGGHKDLIEKLLSKGASIHAASLGAAAGNHRKLLEELNDRHANPKSIAKGAGLSGDMFLIRNSIFNEETFKCALKGAALGGHAYAVHALLAGNHFKKCDIVNAIPSVVLGGTLNATFAIATKSTLLSALYAAAAKGDPTLIEILLHDLNRQNTFKNDVSDHPLYHVCSGAIYGGHTKIFNHYFAQYTYKGLENFLHIYHPFLSVFRNKLVSLKEKDKVVLNFLSGIDNDILRDHFLEEVLEIYPNFGKDLDLKLKLHSFSFLPKKTMTFNSMNDIYLSVAIKGLTKKLNVLHDPHHLSLEESLRYLDLDANAYLCNLHNLSSQTSSKNEFAKLPIEVHLLILSFLCKSQKEAIQIFIAANEKLYSNTLKSYRPASYKLLVPFFANKAISTYQKKKEETEKRLENRLSVLKFI